MDFVTSSPLRATGVLVLIYCTKSNDETAKFVREAVIGALELRNLVALSRHKFFFLRCKPNLYL